MPYLFGNKKSWIVVVGITLLVFAVGAFLFFQLKKQERLESFNRKMLSENVIDYSNNDARKKLERFLASDQKNIRDYIAVLLAVNDSPGFQPNAARIFDNELFEKTLHQLKESPVWIEVKLLMFGKLADNELDIFLKKSSQSAYTHLWKSRFLLKSQRANEAVVELQKALDKPLEDLLKGYYEPLVRFYQHMGLSSLESKMIATAKLTAYRVNQ